MAQASYPEDLLYHPEHDWARIDAADPEHGHARHHLVRPGRARRGRVLRPARRRHDAQQGRLLRRGRVGQGRLGRDRAAVGRDRRGQRGARREPRDDQRGPLRRGLAGQGAPGRPLRARGAAGRRRLPRDAWLARLAAAVEPLHRHHRRQDLDAMLAAIGVGSVQEIFDRQIPEGVRLGPRAGAPRRAARAGRLRAPARRSPRATRAPRRS